MQIHEKLDFLMKLTSTRNNALGRALNFDPSYISRIRSGKRGLPKDQPFIEPASQYFARRIREPYEQRAAADMLFGSSVWPANTDEAARALAAWLSDSLTEKSPGNGIPHPYADFQTEKISLSSSAMPPQVSFYYGNRGKRDGILRFLESQYEEDTPVQLCLTSDEDMTWLYEDPSFARHWAALLIQIAQKGGQIVIIHTVSRNIGEMLEAIRRWSPIYASGMVSPWFCPRVRDGIARRSLFISRGRMGFCSSSVGSNTFGMLNILVSEPSAVHALEGEFDAFFALCRPLMRIYNALEAPLFSDAIQHLFSENGTFFLSRGLGALLSYVNIRAGKGDRAAADTSGMEAAQAERPIHPFARQQKKLNTLIRKRLEAGNTVYEFICLPQDTAASPLPDPAGMPGKEEAVPPSASVCSDLSPQPGQKMLLHDALDLLRRYSSYHVVLLAERQILPLDVLAWHGEQHALANSMEILFSSTIPRQLGLRLTEERLSDSFMEFLDRFIRSNPGRDTVQDQLEKALADMN